MRPIELHHAIKTVRGRGGGYRINDIVCYPETHILDAFGAQCDPPLRVESLVRGITLWPIARADPPPTQEPVPQVRVDDYTNDGADV